MSSWLGGSNVGLCEDPHKGAEGKRMKEKYEITNYGLEKMRINSVYMCV